ncbi:ImmA/IrrE family metallo-endopeptidase [Acetobacterium wieringae]|uniref:ImmA/IrrE family metallo-endopeptidase n=1 Tax=Acetobacterium wieringae TaxID=52694 RepID=UPI00203412FE|nr:ImmA/IrrE family metallo-endopeptidase [Acetobacterium wieringae]URN83521.1 ImmA/IrrE family metallo-endopeptidase [Acetobacterium wieringae]
MFNTQRMKSIFLHQKYKISTFPIPIWEIEQIIIDRGYDVCISNKSKASFILSTTVFVPNFSDTHNRFCLSHELGHIMCNHYDVYRVDKYTKNKYEAQADAFALYLIMPPFCFDRDLEQFNEWDLAEKYGIPVEYVIKRAALITEPSNKEMRLY